MTPTIEGILTQIATDRKKGATALASLGLDALDSLTEALPDDPTLAQQMVVQLIRRLDGIRPSMGAIGVQAFLVGEQALSLTIKGFRWADALKDVIKEARINQKKADKTIAKIAKEEMGTGGILVSCSTSATVETVIHAVKPSLVRLGEGHVMGDGIIAARKLSSTGVKVEVFPDGALPVAVEGASTIIVGADQVLADGSVINRCSSFSLALSGNYWQVPFFVACQGIKLSGNKTAEIETATGLLHDLPSGTTSNVPIFDRTPPELIHAIITEYGSKNPFETAEHGQNLIRRKLEFLKLDFPRGYVTK
jgi:translation initiation factor 2B subunit (eIF-2B alpha/beta/delta family)